MLKCKWLDLFVADNKEFITMEELEAMYGNPNSYFVGQGKFGSVRLVSWSDEKLPQKMRFIAIKSSLYEYTRQSSKQEGEYLNQLADSKNDYFPKFIGCIQHDNYQIDLAMEYLEGFLDKTIRRKTRATTRSLKKGLHSPDSLELLSSCTLKT